MRRPLVIALLLWATPASAYVVMTAQDTGVALRWTSLPMKFNIDQAVPPGLSAAQWQGAIRAGYKTWSDVTCSYYSASDQGVVNMPTGNDSDQINTNVFRSSWPSSYGGNALGITLTKYDPYSGKIIDADTHYNPNYGWAVDGSPWDIDAQSVATHEIGHQLGLDHPPVQTATMFYATGQGDTSQRSLDTDDINGICHIYPSGTTPPPECTTANDCAPNETCTNGKCVTATAKGYGSTCNTSKECTSQLCLSDGSNFFCSEMCSTSDPCPNGDQCLPLDGGGSACLPGSADWGTKDLGQPCQSSLDCKQTPKMYCVSVPGKGYLCASMCDLTKNDCATGYTCTNSNIGGLCIPGTSTNPPPPPPPTKKALGETCTTSTDCQSNLCAQTGAGMVCVQYCNDTDNFCPTGFKCVPAGNMKVCIADASQPPPPQPGALGSSCTTHEDCDSKLCGADASGNRFCTQLCDPAAGCAAGFDCVPAGGGQYACSPSATNPADGGGGGCALRGDAPGGAHGRWLLLVLALPLVLLSRRRR